MPDRAPPPRWTFLTNHAQVLVCVARNPTIRVRDVAERIGITERAAHRIVAELDAAGYITRRRDGRRNTYTINHGLSLPDQIVRGRNLGEFLDVLIEAEN